jgi:hypothetical protein
MPTNFYKVSRSFYGKMLIVQKNIPKRNGLMNKISQAWAHIQSTLFPILEAELDPLTDPQRKLIATLELVKIEDFVPHRWWVLGRRPSDRVSLARAFVAKMVLGGITTSELINQLVSVRNLRRLCGWELSRHVPSESTFSRAFDEFAEIGLADRAQAALIKGYESERLVGHLSRDSTDIPAREKASPKPPKPAKAKRKMGHPRQGEVRPPKAPTLIERQLGMTLAEMLLELPGACNWGAKKKCGNTSFWKGYKFHVDWADGEIPICGILTSASVIDSQVAIPLATMSAQRVTNLYDLMDSAYDSKLIKDHSASLGHVPIIDHNPRGGEKIEMTPAAARRYDERTTAERGFSFLKETFGGRNIRVRGQKKVRAHLMFCLLALTADRLLNLLL